MPSVNDWAAKAAERIYEEFPISTHGMPKVERIAAIIATFAAPLVALLRESRRECSTTCRAYGNYQPPYEECSCGADEWNARVDKALSC